MNMQKDPLLAFLVRIARDEALHAEYEQMMTSRGGALTADEFVDFAARHGYWFGVEDVVRRRGR